MNTLRAALVASLIIFPCAATALTAPDAEPIPDSYATPATRVTLRDGHAINLRCSGQGERAVVFEAGANADSSTWYRVLPMLQGQAQVCAYDRAGYGFSDEGPMPRDLNADVTDLHELIRTAKLPLPIVLVGHSLGSNIVRRYAQQFPGDVAGMVLIDPPGQGADQAMSGQWKRDDAALREQRDAFLAACEKAAEAGDLLASTAGCLRAPPPWMGERVAASVMANKAKPGYWRTLRSELAENQRVFSTPVSPEERYGDIPLVLLSAGESSDAGAPDDVRVALEEAREQTQQRIIAASTHGKRLDVRGASHDIQLDRPQAVASAVTEMLRTATTHPAAKSTDR